MSIESKSNRVLEYARQLSGDVRSWADFSSALFDQTSGYVAKVFPNELQRQLFFDTPQYAEVNKVLVDLMKRFGTIEGAGTSKSGKFLVRVPKTMHKVLEIEAKREGVSLNQLAVSKLAAPLHNVGDMAADRVITAYNEVHDGYSADWIIVSPEFNARFIARCQELGLKNSEAVLNHTLMNVRKNPKNKGRLNPTTKRSGFSSYDDFAFAAEIAVRALQRTEGVTLDRILCDPIFRERFDRLSLQLAPDKTETQLRCAALNLRKTHRLKPVDKEGEDSFDVSKIKLSTAGVFRRLDIDRLAAEPGGYALYDQNRPLFAGETESLKKRVGLHLRYGIPDWFGIDRDDELELRFTALPAKRDNRLEWLGDFINKERPLLNYQKVA
jgi:HicB-like protein involved in pilus formation